MKRNYHTLATQGEVNERKLAEFLAKNGQQILPMVELIAQSRMAVDDLVDVLGRATIETVLQLSAEQVAGAPQQGRKRQGEIVWHGKQAGSVYLKDATERCSRACCNRLKETERTCSMFAGRRSRGRLTEPRRSFP